jgi:hypothetical protein
MSAEWANSGVATELADTGLPVPQVLSTLSVLEMRRLIRRLSGTTVVRP